MQRDIVRWILAGSFGLLAVGGIIFMFQGSFHWLGRLPGDLSIGKEDFRIYFPITSMILLSILLMALVRVAKWILR